MACQARTGLPASDVPNHTPTQAEEAQDDDDDDFTVPARTQAMVAHALADMTVLQTQVPADGQQEASDRRNSKRRKVLLVSQPVNEDFQAPRPNAASLLSMQEVTLADGRVTCPGCQEPVGADGSHKCTWCGRTLHLHCGDPVPNTDECFGQPPTCRTPN